MLPPPRHDTFQEVSFGVAPTTTPLGSTAPTLGDQRGAAESGSNHENSHVEVDVFLATHKSIDLLDLLFPIYSLCSKLVLLDLFRHVDKSNITNFERRQ